MPSQPKKDKPLCDVPGCGSYADIGTDGSEEDVQKLGRKAIPNLNVCLHHGNWPHSEDAQRFIIDSQAYKGRK